MKNLVVSLLIISVIGVIGFALVSQAGSEPTARKIVVFKPGVEDSEKEALVNTVGGTEIKHLRLINGKAALLSKSAEETLLKDPAVSRIDDDVEVFALARPIKIEAKPKSQPAQVLPWGVDRIDAELAWATTTANPIKVAIIDTGIDVKHPDLKDNIKGGVSTVWYTTSYNDDNGHGSHVAGIAAALDNTIGVIGVGPQIDLYSVKVLDRRGSGYLSDVIEGLDWVIINGMDVVNMSLGTTDNILSFQEAVQRVNAAGIVQVAAAGNSGGAVIYPAAYPEVIAVSATDNTNTIASWSSRGPEVDLAAPGVSIYSTYKGQSYKTLSGTSMASPHVAGSAALVLSTPISAAYDTDSDGIWDPNEAQKKLQDRATDLGAIGFDNLYGWGLVNAYNAVQP